MQVGPNVQSSATSDDFPYFQSGGHITSRSHILNLITGSESEDSEEVDPELGRKQEIKQDVLERGKVEELRGIGQGRGLERGAWGPGAWSPGAWRGGGAGRGGGGGGAGGGAGGGGRGGGDNWKRGSGRAHKGEIPRKTIHVKQTLI